jgi:hypothetical protein
VQPAEAAGQWCGRDKPRCAWRERFARPVPIRRWSPWDGRPHRPRSSEDSDHVTCDRGSKGRASSPPVRWRGPASTTRSRRLAEAEMAAGGPLPAWKPKAAVLLNA